MPRAKFWTRGIFDAAADANFTQFRLVDAIAGQTLIRLHFQAWLETLQTIPASGYPLRDGMIFAEIVDGPWSTWISAHPTTPAESTYGWLHYERVQFHSEEHNIESVRYSVYYAPRDNVDRDVRAQRVIKNTGDVLSIMGWLAPFGSSINPFGVRLRGAYEALWEEAP